jgi:serine/threonine-protein kinase
MDPTTWNEVQRIFAAARERQGDDRLELLDQECGSRAGLRRQVERLLAGDSGDAALAIEDRLLGRVEGVDEGDPLAAGGRIGPYRVERLIGEGGMGRVYLAERDDRQYRQRVAIKVVRPGFRGAEMTRRFRLERQLLAQLVHPNIVPLLDGGVLEDGRPYLVLHYVDGAPITDHCDRQRLSVRARLELFLTVCGAVQFAHSHLVVHRDLTPSKSPSCSIRISSRMRPSPAPVF